MAVIFVQQDRCRLSRLEYLCTTSNSAIFTDRIGILLPHFPFYCYRNESTVRLLVCPKDGLGEDTIDDEDLWVREVASCFQL